MLLKKYLLPALFVIAEAISDLPSQNVSVITSKRKILSNFADQPLGEFQKYFNISFCFRFMIQKWKSLTLIKTPQLELFIKNDDKFKGSIYLANSKMKGEGKETHTCPANSEYPLCCSENGAFSEQHKGFSELAGHV